MQLIEMQLKSHFVLCRYLDQNTNSSKVKSTFTKCLTKGATFLAEEAYDFRVSNHLFKV